MGEAGRHDSYIRWTQLMKSGKSKIIYFGKEVWLSLLASLAIKLI